MYRTRFFTSEQYPLLSFRLDSYFLREIVICIRLSPPVQLPSLSPIHSTILLAYTSPKTYLSPRFSATVCCFPTFLFRTPANPTDSSPRTRRLTSTLVPDLWQLPSTPLRGSSSTLMYASSTLDRGRCPCLSNIRSDANPDDANRMTAARPAARSLQRSVYNHRFKPCARISNDSISDDPDLAFRLLPQYKYIGSLDDLSPSAPQSSFLLRCGNRAFPCVTGVTEKHARHAGTPC